MGKMHENAEFVKIGFDLPNGLGFIFGQLWRGEFLLVVVYALGNESGNTRHEYFCFVEEVLDFLDLVEDG